jgi:hypothetical protein
MEPPASRPLSGATAELPRVLVRPWPAHLVRAAGIASTVLGTGHVAGVLRTLSSEAREYDRHLVYLLLLGICMISQGLVLALAARGVREGLSWARGAIIAASGQGLIAMAVVFPIMAMSGPPNFFWAGPIGFGLVHGALLLRFSTAR